MAKITLIAAMSLNGVIGNDNDIPWKSREDLKHFKDTTLGGVVIMGRKTFESMGSKPLSGRVNIALSASLECGFVSYVNESDSLHFAKDIPIAIKLASSIGDKKIFVIGGGEIYKQTIDIADELIISHIHKPVQGTVKFPEIDLDVWKVSKIDHRLESDPPFTIVTYVK